MNQGRGGQPGPVLRKESVAAILKQQNKQVPLDFGSSIGLTWVLDDLGIAGATDRVHSGGMLTFRSMLSFCRSRGSA